MDFMMQFLETLGTVAFSISGAIEAIKKEMDLLGVVVLGLITAVGGGVIRDVVTGEIPPAAFQNSAQAKLAIGVAIIAFFVGAILTKHQHNGNFLWWNVVLFLSDAIGLAAFTILGIRCVQERIGNDNIALLLFVGVVTGVGGGLMRDVLAGNIPYIFPETCICNGIPFGGSSLSDSGAGDTGRGRWKMVGCHGIRPIGCYHSNFGGSFQMESSTGKASSE